MLWLPLRDSGVGMRQRVGREAEIADYRGRQVPAARAMSRRGELVAVDDSPADLELGPSAEAGPVTYSYSRVEERWEIRLRPDGSARASVVVRREQQVGTQQHWRFVARRGLPGEALRRMRRRLAAAGAALVAVVGAGWLAWSAWPRQTSPDPVLVIPIARAPALATPPPVVAPPPAAEEKPAVSRPPARAMVAKAPAVTAPPPSSVEIEAPSVPPVRDERSVGDDRPLDRRIGVETAVARAFASGEAEMWNDGDLSGFVVVGPVDLVGGASCRNTVVLTRGAAGGDQTVSHRRCQAADGSIRIQEGQQSGRQ